MGKAIIESLRPRQWVKNVVIFAGLVFDGQLLQLQPLLRVLLAAVLYCLISGMTYIINDILDFNADKIHPTKRNRPIASGRLGKKQALLVALLLGIIAFPVAFLLSVRFGLICLAYTLMMLAYSKWLKRIMIIDVMIISLGFVLRVAAGIYVISVNYFSPWLFILTSLLALFIGFGKRLAELNILTVNAAEHRPALEGYTINLLNQYLMVTLSAILITYTLYTFSAHPNGENYAMMLTIPFVFYGIFRYMYILQNQKSGAAPEEVLLKDRPLQASILLWGLSALFVLYLIY